MPLPNARTSMNEEQEFLENHAQSKYLCSFSSLVHFLAVQFRGAWLILSGGIAVLDAFYQTHVKANKNMGRQPDTRLQVYSGLAIVLVPMALAIMRQLYVAYRKGVSSNAFAKGFGSGTYLKYTFEVQRDPQFVRATVFTVACAYVVLAFAVLCLLAALVDDMAFGDINLLGNWPNTVLSILTTIAGTSGMLSNISKSQSWVESGIEEFDFHRAWHTMFSERNDIFLWQILEGLWEAKHGHMKPLELKMNNTDRKTAAKCFLKVVVEREAAEDEDGRINGPQRMPTVQSEDVMKNACRLFIGFFMIFFGLVIYSVSETQCISIVALACAILGVYHCTVGCECAPPFFDRCRKLLGVLTGCVPFAFMLAIVVDSSS